MREFPHPGIVVGTTDLGLRVIRQHKTLPETISLHALTSLGDVVETGDTIQIGGNIASGSAQRRR